MNYQQANPTPDFCSFCGAAKTPQQRFVGGPGVAICAACVESAAELLATSDPADLPQPGAGPWDSMDDAQLLDHLPQVAAVQAQVERSLAAWVGIARERKISWEKVGQALGMTRQSAWERFRHSG